MKTGVVAGTGKLTGRFCVRVTPSGKGRMKFFGCFKSEAAARKKLDEAKKNLGVEKGK